MFKPSPQSGCRDGKTAPAKFQVTSRKIKIQLQSTWMLIPNIFPIPKPLRIGTSKAIEYLELFWKTSCHFIKDPGGVSLERIWDDFWSKKHGRHMLCLPFSTIQWTIRSCTMENDLSDVLKKIESWRSFLVFLWLKIGWQVYPTKLAKRMGRHSLLRVFNLQLNYRHVSVTLNGEKL